MMTPTARSHPLQNIVNARFPSSAGYPDQADVFVEGSLHLSEAGWIDGITSGDTPPPVAAEATWLDARDCVVLPGFIDVHIHGCDGHDTMDASPDALRSMSRFLVRHGVTGFYPTTMTAPHAATRAAVRNVAAVTEAAEATPGARILGVHLEGPYISPHYPGAQSKEHVRAPDAAEFLELVGDGPVRLITLAPEQPGARALVDAAVERTIAVVMGHTAATYEQASEAVRWGISQSTHTYNAMTGLHHRRPGVVGVVLDNEAIYAQLIPDTIHVHPAAMSILARCKGPERTLLITDAIRATGLPPGESELGGQRVYVRDGECRLEDGTLAGSIVTMDVGLRHFLRAAGWRIERGWPVTSRTPARAMGIDDEYGSIAPGYRADLAVLNGDLTVVATIVGGRLVYLRDGCEWRVKGSG